MTKNKKRDKRGVTIVCWPLTAPVDGFYFELAYLRRRTASRRSRRACKLKPQWFQYYSPSSHGTRSILWFRGKLSRLLRRSIRIVLNERWTNAFPCPKISNEKNNWLFFQAKNFLIPIRFAACPERETNLTPSSSSYICSCACCSCT